VISQPLKDELVEAVLDQVLEQLDGADDSDTIRAKFVMENWLEEIRGFQHPRLEVIDALELAIANHLTVGELRARIRNAKAEIAS
jgi:hypothetical protein